MQQAFSTPAPLSPLAMMLLLPESGLLTYARLLNSQTRVCRVEHERKRGKSPSFWIEFLTSRESAVLVRKWDPIPRTSLVPQSLFV